MHSEVLLWALLALGAVAIALAASAKQRTPYGPCKSYTAIRVQDSSVNKAALSAATPVRLVLIVRRRLVFPAQFVGPHISLQLRARLH